MDKSDANLFRTQGMDLGLSLFKPVPVRSCTDAGVPLDYCSCPAGHSPLEPALALPLVRAALQDVDTFLRPLWGCRALGPALASLTRVSRKDEGDRGVIQAFAQLSLQPVEFAVKISYSLKDQTDVSASLVRIDRYSATSGCVPLAEAAIARPLCLCPEQ
jgi:hypothetical protein